MVTVGSFRRTTFCGNVGGTYQLVHHFGSSEPERFESLVGLSLKALRDLVGQGLKAGQGDLLGLSRFLNRGLILHMLGDMELCNRSGWSWTWCVNYSGGCSPGWSRSWDRRRRLSLSLNLNLSRSSYLEGLLSRVAGEALEAISVVGTLLES